MDTTTRKKLLGAVGGSVAAALLLLIADDGMEATARPTACASQTSMPSAGTTATTTSPVPC